jgi:hypothetical protein
MSLLTPLFALGLDSAACCMAIGTIALSSGERFRLALAFGACDMAASIVAYPLPASHAFAVYPCCAAR